MPAGNEAVWRNGGLVSSEILLNFAVVWLVRAVAKPATASQAAGTLGDSRRAHNRQDSETLDINDLFLLFLDI
jgi:hypothetical protein